MEQLSIYDFGLDNNDFIFFQNGAMYAKVAANAIIKTPIELGDKTIYPGQFISKLGEKDRTSFKMQEGKFLRYCGKVHNLILFSVNNLESDYYYAFAYVDANTLLICSRSGCRDVRLETLEIYENCVELAPCR